MSTGTIEKIYAGWLGKLIGVRLGAPVEMWSHEQIEEKYAARHGYLVDYQDFAADDDTNGPTFFIRALRDSGRLSNLTSEDVGNAWLQYASWGRGMYWWGGYGVSAEHTAYEHLRAGVPAPLSGSRAYAGKIMSEQIGGQIFIDSWGLVCPGNPAEAARLARIAARVSHDGEAVNGGQFVAACIAAAFTARSVDEMMDAALAQIPEESAYARCVREVRAFHKAHPDDPWACYAWIRENCWKEQWPGNCHILPNSALMILALCYGAGGFDETLELCNRCGFDTDCNAGNIGTMMGVLVGLEGIADSWRQPINDHYVCSSAIGCLNMQDAPSFVRELSRLAAEMGHFQPAPEEAQWLSGRQQVHFFLPGSTCGVRVTEGETVRKGADWGEKRLKIHAPNGRSYAWVRTYVTPEDLHDYRYEPAFSPRCYPGQCVGARICMQGRARIRMEDTLGNVCTSAWVCATGETELSWRIPALAAGCVRRLGVEAAECANWEWIDLQWQGEADYQLNTALLTREDWPSLNANISQFTVVKGSWFLEDGRLQGGGADLARTLTGGIDWENYQVEAEITLGSAKSAALLARVTGAMRCCGVRITADGRVCLFREDGREKILAEARTARKSHYRVALAVAGNTVTVTVEGEKLLSLQAEGIPTHGCIGLDVTCPGLCGFSHIAVKGVSL